MDLPRLALRLGTVAALALLVVLAAFATQRDGGGRPASAVTDEAGAPLPVPQQPGVARGLWGGVPVVVLVVPAEALDAVEALHGEGSATPSVAVPGQPGLRLLALSAKSTHLGCTVGFQPRLGAPAGAVDGRLLDPCSQIQWNPFLRGAQVAGPEVPPLPVLAVRAVDGRVEATGFDGPGQKA